MCLNHTWAVLWFRFLWQQNASFAISRHYRRFDVFEEAEANKAAGKYGNSSIDYQIEFYKKEGLSPYSKAKLPITSGRCIILCVCARASCSWRFVFLMFSAQWLTFCRCSWRLCYHKGTYSHHKSVYLPVVQWSWSVYCQRSVKLLHCEG